MAKLKTVRRDDGSTYGYRFDCPGCHEPHVIATSGDHAWGFSGDTDRPTFTPSYLVYEVKGPDGAVIFPRCHSFVTDGRIAFCSDSGHELAGKTVDLPDI
jgi:hypothetical protein